MTRYPKYKQTGISWLPEIPEEWEMRRVASCLSVKDAPSAPDEELLSVFLDYGVIPFSKGGEKRANATSKDLSKYQLVEINDFVMNNQQAWRGSVGVSKYQGIVSPAYFVIRMDRCLDPVYANLALRSKPFVRLYELCSRGVGSIQRNLNWNMFKQRHIPLPTIQEQRNIAAFLDDKCGKIDKVVAAKENEIELLKELKQTEIADAVTRGISGAPLVNSGIPWLPKIPKGWEVKRAKYLFNKEQRAVVAGDEIVTCFRDGEVTLRKNRRTTGFTEATDYSHYQHICKGDLVIHQMDAFAGSTGVSDSDGMGTPVLSVCSPKSKKVYVYYFAKVIRLMGLNGFIQSLYRGIRERSSDFRFDTFAKQLLPVPPLAEQKEIVAYIEKKVAEIDAAVKGLEEEVAALKEYKQRLISDVVTGQVKV